jgi:8-oxo-dGTP diphosphatase
METINNRVVAIIVDKNCVLLIHRLKPDQDYYVLPGGSTEPNETLEEACIREVKEETGLVVTLEKNVFIHENNNRVEYYYKVSKYHGQLQIGEPENSRQNNDNQYMIEWVDVEALKHINLQPKEIRSICIDCVLAK